MSLNDIKFESTSLARRQVGDQPRCLHAPADHRVAVAKLMPMLMVPRSLPNCAHQQDCHSSSHRSGKGDLSTSTPHAYKTSSPRQFLAIVPEGCASGTIEQLALERSLMASGIMLSESLDVVESCRTPSNQWCHDPARLRAERLRWENMRQGGCATATVEQHCGSGLMVCRYAECREWVQSAVVIWYHCLAKDL